VKLDKSQLSKVEFKRLKAYNNNLKNKKKAEKRLAKIREVAENFDHIEKSHQLAFVLGNGTSRLGINLDKLKATGTIYGCNALYREFSPDYLVAVDVKMILEINKAGYQNKNTVWTNPNKSYERMKNFNYFQPSKGWSSGPTALWLACQHKWQQIYILGFDYKGLQEGKKLNNVYADTPNYKKSSDGATFFGNWMRQTKMVISDNKNIEFIRIVQSDTYNPGDLEALPNYKTIDKEFFIKFFNL
jgi:hypothetical protein